MQRLLVLGFCALLLAGCPSTPADPDAPADVPVLDVRTGRCIGDDECSDGNFCNGLERCEPISAMADDRGCVPSRGRPCLEAQVCEEATDTCVTDCGVSRDADRDGANAMVCGGDDCDDADALAYPDATEVCDDEDRDEDCDPTTFGSRDLDRDGSVSSACCNVSSTSVRTCGDDCNDTLRGVRPTATETCNGRDDDCNGVIDEGATVPGFADRDRDLHGDPSMPAMVCPAAVGSSALDDDCNDDPMRGRNAHGAQLEICDEVDNDCDDETDEHARAVTWYRDDDGDGFGSAASGTMVSCTPLSGYALLPTDCDDGNPSISPAAAERCNGLDDDCDGLLNGFMVPGDFEDDDGDGFLDSACGGDDCDDLDWNAYPDAPEICDFRDSDCDGLSDLGRTPPMGAMADTTAEVDWYGDVDQDGWGAGMAIRSCEPQPGRTTRSGDCADADASRHPSALDVCNGRDDDCDPQIDEDTIGLAYYADGDGDGDGAGAATIACRPPMGLTDLPGDCAPADPTRGPSTFEVCDTVDQDCDTQIDEALFRDVDGDGHGDPDAPVTGMCMLGDVGNGDDCNDAIPTLNPSVTEICNGLDDDCDGVPDEPGAELCVAGRDHGMCMAGACVFTCDPGEADCDGDATNGCETTLATDPAHCGTCPTECGIGGTCSSGACDPIVGVAVAANHACAWRQGGGVLCWGSNSAGALGVPASVVPSTGVASTTLAPVPLAGIVDAAELCTGDGFTCARRRTGEVECWGAANSGQRGLGVELSGFRPDHTTIPSLSDAVELDCGITSVCARRASGRVLCWGGGGAANWGSAETGAHPREVPGMSDVADIEMHGSTNVLYGITRDGRLLSVGGLPVYQYTSTGEASSLFPEPVARVLASSQPSCAILRSGALWCWGRTDGVAPWTGILDLRPMGLPEPISSASWPGLVQLAHLPGVTMCGVLADGRVTCSGTNNALGGCTLGDGCPAAPAVGVFATGLTDAIEIDGAGTAFCSVRRRGDVVCWGGGPIGHGGNAASTPVRVLSD